MTNDAEWVEDMKRWIAGVSVSAARVTDHDESTDMMALGYEAAHPALQARYWPAAMTTAFSDSI